MKKIAPYIFIFIILVGIFSPMGWGVKYAEAGACQNSNTLPATFLPQYTKAQCTPALRGSGISWNPEASYANPGASGAIGPGTGTCSEPLETNELNCTSVGGTWTPARILANAEDPSASEFQKRVLNDNVCGIGIGEGTPTGCIVQIFYYVLYALPARLLYLAAYFFNVLISVSLDGTLFKHAFVSEAWGVVRDLSNGFFILILLYIAIKMILGLGGSEVKKMITQVIIMALLINFSMFMTQIVIDTSNVLALVFYNKLEVKTNVNGRDRPYTSVAGEKDVAGGMVSAFDPTSRLGADFFEETKKIYDLDGRDTGRKEPEVSAATLIFIICLSGLVMGLAAYSLFISGLSFVGRMIELWRAIIFSPFAFMSSTVPLLNDIEELGWKSWLAHLLKSAFMAPIFMFFLYFIFLLIRTSIFSTFVQGGQASGAGSSIKTLLGVLIPTAFILALLLKATEFAKKGSGKFGELVINTAKTIGGLAIATTVGAGAGLAAAGLQGSLGHLGKRVAESSRLADLETSTQKGWRGNLVRFTGSRLRTYGSAAATGSFDARTGLIGAGLGAVSKLTGVRTGHDSKIWRREAGGYEADLKRRDEKRKKRVEGLKVKEGEPEKQALNKVEDSHQDLLVKNDNAHKISEFDKKIEAGNAAIRIAADASRADPTDENKRIYKEATDKVVKLKADRKALKDGRTYDTDPVTGAHTYNTTNGKITEDEVKQARDEDRNATAAEVVANTKLTAATTAETAALAALTTANTAETAALAADAAAKSALLRTPTSTSAINDAKTAAAALATATASTTRARTDATTAGDAVTAATTERTAAVARTAAASANKLRAESDALAGTGRSINNLEDTDIPHAKHDLESKSKKRGRDYSTNLENQIAFPWNKAARDQSAHDIRMGVKLDSGSGGKGGGH